MPPKVAYKIFRLGGTNSGFLKGDRAKLLTINYQSRPLDCAWCAIGTLCVHHIYVQPNDYINIYNILPFLLLCELATLG